jgi:hypothetical protein
VEPVRWKRSLVTIMRTLEQVIAGLPVQRAKVLARDREIRRQIVPGRPDAVAGRMSS